MDGRADQSLLNNEATETSAQTGQAAPAAFPAAQLKKFAVAAALLTLGFAVPLWCLFRNAVSDDLYSYIPLMPAVSGYLAWLQKSGLTQSSPPAKWTAALFWVVGAAGATGYILLARTASPATIWNSLALGTFAWLTCLVGLGWWFLGRAAMRALAFPFCVLFCMVPFPVPVRDGMEAALQHGSALVAEWMYLLSGTPVLRDDVSFRLPGFSLRVAPECSGIHSTWILLITSLVAGHLILRRPWRRAVLCLVVIPLALLRNGFRVFVIGELCVHVGPQMIDSPIHHHGGPLFFVLSLVPFFLLLYYLRKREGTDVAGQEPRLEE